MRKSAAEVIGVIVRHIRRMVTAPATGRRIVATHIWLIRAKTKVLVADMEVQPYLVAVVIVDI